MKLHLRRKIASLLALVLTLGCAVPVSTTVKAEEGYSVTVSTSATEVEPGDTVSLTATVTKGEEEITDLAGEGLYLWWWTDV
ncbi:MAG: hypothetical protein LUC90_11645 [Lachnospiraceae bacterium]|nr:hypothetical protein [Lachnospiraceae bacterium]